MKADRVLLPVLLLLASLLSLGSCATGADLARAAAHAAAVDPARPFPESAFLVSDGLSLHYRHWKPARPTVGRILLLHGFGSSTFSFRFLVPELLGAGWEVAAVDIPPFGYSDKSEAIARLGYNRGHLLWAVPEALGWKGPVVLLAGAEVPDEMVDGYAAPFQAPGGIKALFAWSAKGGERARVHPQSLVAPTLLVWGEKDATVPLKVGKELEAAIAGSRLVVLPGLGHLAHELRPDQVDPLVLGFLAGLEK